MASSLGNRSVVITRSLAQNESLRHLLEARGADVVEVPLIAIAEPDDDGRERDEVLQRFHEFAIQALKPVITVNVESNRRHKATEPKRNSLGK